MSKHVLHKHYDRYVHNHHCQYYIRWSLENTINCFNSRLSQALAISPTLELCLLPMTETVEVASCRNGFFSYKKPFNQLRYKAKYLDKFSSLYSI